MKEIVFLLIINFTFIFILSKIGQTEYIHKKKLFNVSSNFMNVQGIFYILYLINSLSFLMGGFGSFLKHFEKAHSELEYLINIFIGFLGIFCFISSNALKNSSYVKE